MKEQIKTGINKTRSAVRSIWNTTVPVRVDTFDDFTKQIAKSSPVHVWGTKFQVGIQDKMFVPEAECVGIKAEGKTESGRKVKLKTHSTDCFELGTLSDPDALRQISLEQTDELRQEIVNPLQNAGHTVVFNSLRGRMDEIGFKFNSQERISRADSFKVFAIVQPLPGRTMREIT